MSLDSNLLKEAIADAKAVRQTALANAKVALEEAFSERYHAVFAEKLKEEAAIDAAPAATPAPVKEEETVSEQEIDELIKELEAEVGEEKPEAPVDAAPPMDDAAPEAPEMPEVPAEAPAVADGAPLTAGQTVKLVPVADAAPAPEVPPVDAGAPEPVTPPSEVPPTDDLEEEINLDELLQSLKEEIEGEEKKEKKDEEDCVNEDKKLSSSAIGGKVGGSDNKKPSASASSSSNIESGGCKDNGMPESKVESKDATDASRPNKAKNATSTNLSTPSKGGEAGPALKAARPNSKGEFEGTAKLSESTNAENAALKKQLDEATEVIKYVKGQLNEVNLLNAKLLYTNKLFKEFAMGNEQKMRVVEMFDLAKNVREVKLTYANIAESLNFGATETKKKAQAPASVQSITEGLASKPVGSTKPSPQIIAENKVPTQVSRFQKLAGIK